MRAAVRPRPPAPEDFPSRLRSAAVASRVGLWLGVAFGVCFVTGLVSHYAQLPAQPVPFPASPAWGYRLTQGLHVTSGAAAVPLLLVKLWTVYPRLFLRPPRQGRALLVEVAERGSTGVLVASAVFLLASGLANMTAWYPWDFSFRSTHYAIAWVAIGALVLHVAVKLPRIRQALGSDVDDDRLDRRAATEPGALSRRELLRTTWLAAGVATLATAGNSIGWLRDVSVLAVRSSDGPQGLPVTKSATAAGVLETAASPSYRLSVEHAGRTSTWSLEDLQALPQSTETLPIACVEGWSENGEWTGVRLRTLLDLVGAPTGVAVAFESLQESGPFRTSVLPASFADDDRTLVALRLNGETLALDHGYPARLIAPNRPGVRQTKWLARVAVG
jgi:hypothetical protein